MCMLLSTSDHPDYALILISNRDEIFERKSLRMHEHDELQNRDLLMGIDQVGKGTWLCVDKENKSFSVVMNVQSKPESPEKECSRGLLPLKIIDYIDKKEQVPKSYQQFEKYYNDLDNTRFFKLIYGKYNDSGVDYQLLSLADDNVPIHKDLAKLGDIVTSNEYDSESKDFTDIPWTKLDIGRELIKQLKNVREEDELIRKCFEISQNNTFDSTEECLDFQQSKKKVRSSIFIPPHDVLINNNKYKYGTRTTTLILIRKNGTIKVVERERVCDDAGDSVYMI